MEIELRRLGPGSVGAADLTALTKVLHGAPRYHLHTQGCLPDALAAQRLLAELPSAYAMEDKYFYAILHAGTVIGCADLLKGWKGPQQSMLGLLLIEEPWQGRGVGSSVFQQLEKIVADWPGMRSIRLGVVRNNLAGLAFWRAMGFEENGEIYQLDNTLGDTLIMEKQLAQDDAGLIV